MKDSSGQTGVSIGEKLKQARQAKGWSTRTTVEKLRARISLSHGTLANYEKGTTHPPVDVLALLATLYDRPINWFLGNQPILQGVKYRHLKSKTGVRARQQFEAESQRWLDAYSSLECALDQPLRAEHQTLRDRLETANVTDATDSPVAAAGRLRDALGLDHEEPVQSVIDILEASNVRTIATDTELEVEGMAARLGNQYVVVLSQRSSNDRIRMTAAHELGHVLAGDCGDEPESKEEESRAFEFASHFLLTSKMLAAAFRRKSMVDLMNFKKRYGISMAAMVYRAQQEGTITDAEARNLWIEFSKRGWRRNEPGHVGPDRPTRFEALVEYAVSERGYDFARVSEITGVRENELRRRIDMVLHADTMSDDLDEPPSSGQGLRLVE